jgi:hypothetical protein
VARMPLTTWDLSIKCQKQRTFKLLLSLRKYTKFLPYKWIDMLL